MSIYIVLIGTLLASVLVILSLSLLNDLLPHYSLQERISAGLFSIGMFLTATTVISSAIMGIMALWEKLVWI